MAQILAQHLRQSRRRLTEGIGGRELGGFSGSPQALDAHPELACPNKVMSGPVEFHKAVPWKQGRPRYFLELWHNKLLLRHYGYHVSRQAFHESEPVHKVPNLVIVRFVKVCCDFGILVGNLVS